MKDTVLRPAGFDVGQESRPLLRAGRGACQE